MLPPGLELPFTNLLRPVSLRPGRQDFDRLRQICELIGSISEGLTDVELAPVVDHILLAAWELYGQLARSSDAPLERVSDEVIRVRAFERSIEANLTARQSIEWHASQVGISVRSLRRACEQVLGTPPNRHLDGLLALEARRRLAHTDAPVERIADELGFTEATNFTKLFVRMTGTTPRAFRARAGRD